ncbi:MAG TPA: serine hydrolase domain-containing protein [Candidatus Binatia bacterium]|nr:serine hydrolase domain-containing protein [Candidatus Binatia bacterium]
MRGYCGFGTPSLRALAHSAITRTDHSIQGSLILHDASILVSDCADQDARFSVAFSIVSHAIEQHAFPAAAIAVTLQGKLLALKSFGSYVYREDLNDSSGLNLPADFASAVTPSTLFDVASLTKPVATTTMAMMLYERGLLELDSPIVGTIQEFRTDSSGSDPRRSEVTFRMLLAHSSGLPAYEKLFLRAHSRDELLQAAFTTPLTADPGTRAEYSDIGFIILTEGLERIAGEPLDIFCQREIFGPLGMANTGFNPPFTLRSKIPPTADEREECGAGAPAREKPSATSQPGVSPSVPRSTFRQRIIQGEVQDENAFVLGGVAGHAGLFSRAEELAIFAKIVLARGSPILRPETIALFTQRESEPAGTSRALGWDTPSSPSQSGKHFGLRSYGHLGYTGTSLWIDPDRQLSITLLTNRTWPDCSNQAIKQVRPAVHDAIMEAIL